MEKFFFFPREVWSHLFVQLEVECEKLGLFGFVAQSVFAVRLIAGRERFWKKEILEKRNFHNVR